MKKILKVDKPHPLPSDLQRDSLLCFGSDLLLLLTPSAASLLLARGTQSTF